MVKSMRDGSNRKRGSELGGNKDTPKCGSEDSRVERREATLRVYFGRRGGGQQGGGGNGDKERDCGSTWIASDDAER